MLHTELLRHTRHSIGFHSSDELDELRLPNSLSARTNGNTQFPWGKEDLAARGRIMQQGFTGGEKEVDYSVGDAECTQKDDQKELRSSC